MSAFYDNSITDNGRLLMADIQMGAKFVPTKIVIGSGYMPTGKTVSTMTSVAEVVKELPINKAEKLPDGEAIFGGIFTNEDITQAFYYRELGLYAKAVYFAEDGSIKKETPEVLYSYGNAGANAELIPAYGTGSIIERQLDLLVYIGNDTIVNLMIETGLYVTIPVFNDTVERLEKDIEEVRYIVDSVTTEKYQWNMSSGDLSLKSVSGSGEVNIADKETQDVIKTTVDTINTNTGSLSSKIGTTTDGSGTVSSGSLFAKLNKLITDITAHIANWSVARAAKIDTIETNTAINNTANATGTLSQKLSSVITSEEANVISLANISNSLSDVKTEISNANIIHIANSDKKAYFEFNPEDEIVYVKEA